MAFRLRRALVAGAAGLTLAASPLAPAARAQSFDCAKAHSPVEQAICAEPALRALDARLAAAYAAALAREPQSAEPVRRDQRNWLRRRAACVAAGAPAAVSECLRLAYALRLAELQPAGAAPAAAVPPSPGGPRAASAAEPGSAPAAPAAPTPAAPAAPTPAAPTAPTAPSGPTSAPPPAASAPAARAGTETESVAGLPAPATPAATLERERVPTAGRTDVLLRVTVPGRFAIRAASATGAALQLVDMLTGPGEQSGWPGRQDGRIDALLDVGTYKLRAWGDPAAAGETTLSVTGFAEAGPARLLPGYQAASLDLRDLQSRSFWFTVAAGDPPLRIEAAGRSLAALSVWRDGRDLVQLPASTELATRTPSRPLTHILLTGPLPPGTYLLRAYGGPRLPWADGAEEDPFHLRSGVSDALLAGGTAGSVGMFGTELFLLPREAARAVFSLPQPAPATLRLVGPRTTQLLLATDRRARAPSGVIWLPPSRDGALLMELRAAPGQAYALRLGGAGTDLGQSGFGPLPTHEDDAWLGLEMLGAGGDEAPAAALLLRTHPIVAGQPVRPAPEVLAAPGVPEIGPAASWRVRFNLRGPTGLLVHATAALRAALTAEGAPLRAAITTPDGAEIKAPGGKDARAWELAAGWYRLVLVPEGPGGLVDVTLGPAGRSPPPPAPAGPASPVLSFGEQRAVKGTSFAVAVNRIPAAPPRLIERSLPADVGGFPFIETLAPGQSASRALFARVPGRLLVRDLGSGALLDSRAIDGRSVVTLNLPAAGQSRTLGVGLGPVAAPAPAPAPAPAAPPRPLRAGEPRFVTLERDGQAEFALDVGEGGLYQLQTLGRLRIAGALATSFVPDLGHAEANGAGQNMLLQRYLRAGRYRLQVRARDSAGRVGVLAAPAPLAEGPALLPGLSARATLGAGSAVAFPIRIEQAGRYRLDLLGDGRRFSARLEDAQGWPLLPAGPLSRLEQRFEPGRYRLIVEPAGVEARVLARLQPIEPPALPSGHGPHPLPFGAEQTAQWREPQQADAARAPDLWRFDLAGPARVTLRLEGEGMEATLLPEPPDAGPSGAAVSPGPVPAGAAAPLGRALAGLPLSLDLPAGHYRVAAMSLRRNDRLTYRIGLDSDSLQPGVARAVELPADLPFALAEPGVASLTSFGPTPLRAELRDEQGRVLARAAGRTDDWNIALSRRLPAGRYRLLLAPLASAAPEGDPGAAAADDGGEGEGGASGAAAREGDAAASDGEETAAADTPDEPPPASDDAAEAAPPRGPVEVTLRLPAERPALALPAGGALTLDDGGVQHATLPPARAGELLVLAAESPVETVLALESRQADGGWRTIGQSQGLQPLLAVPAPAGAGELRASIWSLDGGRAPIRLAASVVAAEPAPPGPLPSRPVPLRPVPLGGVGRPWFAAAIADPGARLLRVAAAGDPVLLAASAPGEPAEPPAGGLLAARSEQVWLVASAPGDLRVGLADAGAGPLDLVLAPAARARLDPGEGACGFIARSGLGQPGLEAGRGMGVAQGSAFALCGGGPVGVWAAGEEETLRLSLRRVALVSAPAQTVDQSFAGLLAPRSATVLRLPAGLKRLSVSLPPGGALVAGGEGAGTGAEALTIWAGEAALSRAATGTWREVTLVNAGDASAPATLTALPTAEPWALAPGAVFRRFFGAAGSFSMPVAGAPGQRLVVAGDATATLVGADGRVGRGPALALGGAGRVEVTHGPGAVALWIEGEGASPWSATPARPVTLPAQVALEGPAMVLRLRTGAPVLLSLSTTGPVILSLGDEAPRLFGQGATLARYLPAGETALRLLAPQDGPLSGRIEIAGTPVVAAGEGLGPPVAVAPGGAALFGIAVRVAGPVGLGVRADPDLALVRLLDEHGAVLGTGVSMLRTLPPGRYVLEARLPPDAPTALVRAAVFGTEPHPSPPPPEVIGRLLRAAGLVPTATAP